MCGVRGTRLDAGTLPPGGAATRHRVTAGKGAGPPEGHTVLGAGRGRGPPPEDGGAGPAGKWRFGGCGGRWKTLRRRRLLVVHLIMSIL